MRVFTRLQRVVHKSHIDWTSRQRESSSIRSMCVRVCVCMCVAIVHRSRRHTHTLILTGLASPRRAMRAHAIQLALLTLSNVRSRLIWSARADRPRHVQSNRPPLPQRCGVHGERCARAFTHIYSNILQPRECECVYYMYATYAHLNVNIHTLSGTDRNI